MQDFQCQPYTLDLRSYSTSLHNLYIPCKGIRIMQDFEYQLHSQLQGGIQSACLPCLPPGVAAGILGDPLSDSLNFLEGVM